MSRSAVRFSRPAHAWPFRDERVLSGLLGYGDLSDTESGGRTQPIPIADTSIDVVAGFVTLQHFARRLMSSPNRALDAETATNDNEWHRRELDRCKLPGYLPGGFAHGWLRREEPARFTIDGAGADMAHDADWGRPFRIDDERICGMSRD